MLDLPTGVHGHIFDDNIGQQFVIKAGTKILVSNGQPEADWSSDLPLGPSALRFFQCFQHSKKAGRVSRVQGKIR
ncbi:MAG TPA: hypothetical protein DEP47_07115 [Chloroflexi bacterium]|nr:hypothetical protein [Chloroflexota bacterium]